MFNDQNNCVCNMFSINNTLLDYLLHGFVLVLVTVTFALLQIV